MAPPVKVCQKYTFKKSMSKIYFYVASPIKFLQAVLIRTLYYTLRLRGWTPDSGALPVGNFYTVLHSPMILLTGQQ